MKKGLLLVILLIISHSWTLAQNWDVIRNSGDYYYGEGTGETKEAAEEMALVNLLQMISVHVSSDFESIYDGVTKNGQLDWSQTVRNCVQTYAHSTLTNVETWEVSKAPKAVVRKYMLKSELQKTYEARIHRLQDMIKIADKSLERGNIDVALQYYYWAYSFVRSLQHPAEVKNQEGLALINTLPNTIKGILDDIKVEYVGQEDEFVDLRFTYQGRPVTIDFTYNDGRKDGCDGKAEGGNACIEMAPGYASDGYYHIMVEYEYRNFARGDAEVQSVLDVIPRREFGKSITVAAPKGAPVNKPKVMPTVNTPVKENKTPATQTGDEKRMAETMNAVLAALQSRQYEKAYSYLTGRGYDNYVKLISRRAGRVIDSSKLEFVPGANGLTYVRGLQMGFSVTERGRKTTLVDDVIFTFDQNQKISNVTFGIGSIAEKDLRNKNVNWGEETRQQVLDFLENYKTAYCLKDSAYIEAIFDENATIIVGHVAKRTTRPGFEESNLPEIGQKAISYTRYTKSEYIKHLKSVFKRNQFINIKFTDNDVSRIESENGKVFAIKIAQEYSSSTYADNGYLYLEVDMTNADEPLIKIRTWQPKPDPVVGLYGPGHFHK